MPSPADEPHPGTTAANAAASAAATVADLTLRARDTPMQTAPNFRTSVIDPILRQPARKLCARA
jgi:hypothetical protein